MMWQLILCCILILAVQTHCEVQEVSLQNQLKLSEGAAKTFLHSRRKRSLYEECREGCWWEEVEEVNGHHEWIREYMRNWNCAHRTRCTSGYYCVTTGSDYRRNTYLSQACYRVSCGSPPSAAQATISGNSYLFRDQVTYVCNNGYEITSGSAVLECQSNKQWNGAAPVCSRVNCNDPGLGTSASRTLSGTLYTDTVSYSCATGYERKSGDYTLSCQANKSWNGSQLVCGRKSCGDPGIPQNSTRVLGGTLYGDNVNFFCATGYVVDTGNAQRTCTATGKWSGSVFSCKRITCPTPPSVQNASLQSKGFRFLDGIQWTCDPGYELKTGDRSLSCLSSGNWNGSHPTCGRISCGVPPASTNALSTGSGQLYLDQVTYSCAVGYEYQSGSYALYCQSNRTWNGSALACKRVTCGDPGQVQNASRTLPGVLYQDTVSYTCNTGYVQAGGSVQRTCTSGRTWNGTTFSCTRITCPTPPSVQNASLQSKGFRFLDGIQWTCDPGYELKTGDRSLSCLSSGNWNGSYPSCGRVSCGDPGKGINAVVTSGGHLYLDEVSYTCNIGYEQQSGSKRLRCLSNRSWNGTALSCTRVSCGDPGVLQNATRVLSGVLYQDTVQYTCAAGYVQHTGSFNRSCQAGRTWSGNPPVCTRHSCGAPSSVPNSAKTGTAYRYLDKVSYTCNVGYESTGGNLTRTCDVTASWSGQQPSCTRVICPTPTMTNAHISNSSQNLVSSTWLYEDVIQHTCNPGYRHSQGDAIRSCTASRTFNGTDFLCIDINECASNPCQNGGQCNNLNNAYSCTCFHNFLGVTCSIAPTGTAASAILSAVGTQTLQAASSLTGAGAASQLFDSCGPLQPTLVSILICVGSFLLLGR